ncbi:MAG: hypothetical protein OCD76_00380 [Reichenbachiella sp.]
MKNNLKSTKLARVLCIITLITGTFYACQDQLEVKPEPKHLTEEDMHGMTKLGKKIDDPYTIENMQKAWDNLKQSNSAARSMAEDISIETSHLYIRFTPADSTEAELLRNDSTLTLYDYPLDYEIDSMGSFYHDPTIPIGQPNYQYCAVEVGRELPNVTFELLKELFIPEELEEDSLDNQTGARLRSTGLTDALVDEALKLTGNLEEDEVDANGRIKWGRPSKWRPKGRIRVWDNQSNCSLNSFGNRKCTGGYVPVRGVEVRLTRYYRTMKGISNSEGYFECSGSRFRRSGKYSIKWERYQFSIRDGTFGQAKTNSGFHKSDWNLNLGSNNSDGHNNTGIVKDKQQYFALVFQAAYDFYYLNPYRLKRPPLNGVLKPQMKIAAQTSNDQNEKNSKNKSWQRFGGILPTIHLRRYKGASENVYGTTIHELTHSAHWNMHREAFKTLVKNAYIPPYNWFAPSQSKAVIESWADGVEWVMTKWRYNNKFGNTNYQYDVNYQNRKITKDDYTSIVVDLLDDYNQFSELKNNPDYPIDLVKGYTILQVQDALISADDWWEWRDRIITKHYNKTENKVEELFNNWY